MKKISSTLLFLIIIASIQVKAQTPQQISSEWKVLSNQELMNKKNLSMAGLPIYGLDGKLIKTKVALEMTGSRDYLPQYLSDKAGKVVAVQLIKMPEAQKKMIAEFMARQKELEALVGTDAKNFVTTDMDGKPVNLSDMKGSVVAINFWFIGCKPCIMEMPELNDIVEKFEGKNVKFIAIALDSKASLKAFEEKREFNYNIIPDGRSVAQSYDITGYPTHCIVDQDGKIQYFKSAYSPQTAHELESKISELLKN